MRITSSEGYADLRRNTGFRACEADFNVTTNAGAAQQPDTVTEPNSDGIYLCTRASNFVDGYVDLVVSSSLSLDAYESTGKVAVNVP